MGGNRRGRKPAQPGQLNPRGLLPEGNVPVARLTATADMIAAGTQSAAYSATAKTLGELGRKVGRMADTAAASEGARAGLTAGLDLNYRPTGDTSIRGAAFERTATATYLDNLNTNLRQDIIRVSDLHKGNPIAMAGAFKVLDVEYRAKHVLGEFPEADAVYRRVFERQAQAAVRGAERAATSAANSRARADRKAAFNDDLDQRLKDLQRNAFGLGLGEEADELVGGDLVDLRSHLDATDDAGKRLVPAGEAGRLFRKAEVGVARARVQSSFEALETMASKEAFLDAFEDDYIKGAGVLKVFELSDFKRLRSDMEGAIRADDSAEAASEADARREITKTGYDLMADEGLTPEWIEANRETINVSDYRAFTRSLIPGGTTVRTDPQEYLRLLDLAETDPEQAIDDVSKAYGGGIVAKDVFNRIYSRANGNLAQAGGRSYGGEMRGFLRSSLAPDRDAPRSYKARQIDALFQFDDWRAANPQATREDLRGQAQVLIDDYRSIGYASGVSELPMPRYYAGTREGFDTKALGEAKAATAAQYRAGALSAREASEQAAILRRWNDIIRFRK